MVKSPIRIQRIIENEDGVIWGTHHRYVFIVVRRFQSISVMVNQCAMNKTLLAWVLKGLYHIQYHTLFYRDCFNRLNVNSVPNQPGVHGMKWYVHSKLCGVLITSGCSIEMSCDIRPNGVLYVIITYIYIYILIYLCNLSKMLMTHLSPTWTKNKNTWHMTESQSKSHILTLMLHSLKLT